MTTLHETKIFLVTAFLLTLGFLLSTTYAEGPKHTYNSLSIYVDTNHGKDSNPGTIDLPFKTINKARKKARKIKKKPVTVYMREGIYSLEKTIKFEKKDSGSEGVPRVYMAYPGEKVRIMGAIKIESSWFKLVSDKSPVWNRIDASAKGNLMQVDLKNYGITDYGTLQRRSTGAKSTVVGAMELFYDGQPMTLARWPNKDFTDDQDSSYDNEVQIYGITKPDITGSYVKYGTQDGVPAYKRNGLVNGKQYNLYRCTWDYGGKTHTAWFITTGTVGYPTKDDPWWHCYSNNLGQFKIANGAVGNASYHNSQTYKGFTSIPFVPDNDNDGQSDRHGKTFVYSGDRPKRWENAKEIWFHGLWWYLWSDNIIKGTVNTEASTITLNEMPTYGIRAEQPFYVLNLLEEIDTPGEWYLDRKPGILYFWPPGDNTTAEIYCSMLEEPLISLNKTSYLTFKDITFEMTRSQLVKINNGSHILIDNCKLRNAGTDAVDITGSNNGLNHCEIYNIGSHGVKMSGGERASLTLGDNYVTNCDIHNFGRWEMTYREAIKIRGCGNIASHNVIHDAPHAAIMFFGNEHLIEYNEIFDVCKMSSDAAAIYTDRDWGFRGNIIRYNFIHHLSGFNSDSLVHGVYLDGAASGITVFGNLFYEINGYATMNNGGRDNIFTNNLFVKCKSAHLLGCTAMAGVNNIPGDSWNLLEKLSKENIQYLKDPWRSKYPALATIPNDYDEMVKGDWRKAGGSVFSRNIGWQNKEWIREGSWGGFKGSLNDYEEISNNIENQDTHFVDELNLNLNLQQNSPAYTIPGFQKIPFDQIGIGK